MTDELRPAGAPFGPLTFDAWVNAPVEPWCLCCGQVIATAGPCFGCELHAATGEHTPPSTIGPDEAALLRSMVGADELTMRRRARWLGDPPQGAS